MRLSQLYHDEYGSLSRVPSNADETGFSSLNSLTVIITGWIVIAKLWNELQRDVVEADNLERFKSKLKLYV